MGIIFLLNFNIALFAQIVYKVYDLKKILTKNVLQIHLDNKLSFFNINNVYLSSEIWNFFRKINYFVSTVIAFNLKFGEQY